MLSMDTVVGVDEANPRGRGPALESTIHAQFHEIAIPIHDLTAIPSPRHSSNLSTWIRALTQDDPIFDGNGTRPVSKEPRLGAKPGC